MKILKTLLLLFLLLPSSALADFSVPMTATSTTQGWVRPSRVNGVEQALVSTYFVATSTTATSTFAGFVNVNGTNSTSTFQGGLKVNGLLHAAGGLLADVQFISTGNITTSGTITSTNNANDCLVIDTPTLVVDCDVNRIGVGTTTPASLFSIENTAGASPFAIGSSTGSTFYVDSSGQVGIGVTAPFSVFHATRSSGAGMTLQRTTATAVTGDILGTLTAYNGATRTSIFEMNSDGATDSGQMAFWNKATGGSITPNMTIKSSGLIGIGTQSPMTAIPFNNIYTGGGLEVRNTSSAAIAISSNVPDLYFNDMDGSASQKSFGFRVNAGKVTQALFSDAGGTLFNPMTYDMATGFVGVSTTSPSMTFSIGDIGTATSTTYKASGTNKGHCEIWADSDGSGVTYVTANNGVLTASTVPCN